VTKWPFAAVCVAALAAAPRTAWAEAHGLLSDTVFLPIGASVGVGVHPGATSGLTLGGEVSLVRVEERLLWYGGWVDGVHDFGSRSTRVGAGPELGIGPFGVDAGYLASIDDAGRTRHGLMGRVLLTIGFVGLYGRAGHLFGDAGPRDHGEVGVLAKLPIELWHPGDRSAGPRPPLPPPHPRPSHPPAPSPRRRLLLPSPRRRLLLPSPRPRHGSSPRRPEARRGCTAVAPDYAARRWLSPTRTTACSTWP
jgi:hypothetical protein